MTDAVRQSLTPDHRDAHDWWTEASSPKAWMSVRDADLLEALLHRQAVERTSPLRVLEWGSGRSTLWYTRYLELLRRDYLWVTIEHDQDFLIEPSHWGFTRGARSCGWGLPR